MQHYSDVVPGSTPFQSLPVTAVKQRVSLNHAKPSCRVEFSSCARVPYSTQFKQSCKFDFLKFSKSKTQRTLGQIQYRKRSESDELQLQFSDSSAAVSPLKT